MVYNFKNTNISLFTPRGSHTVISFLVSYKQMHIFSFLFFLNTSGGSLCILPCNSANGFVLFFYLTKYLETLVFQDKGSFLIFSQLHVYIPLHGENSLYSTNPLVMDIWVFSNWLFFLDIHHFTHLSISLV